MSDRLVIIDVTAQQALQYKEQLSQDGLVVNQDYWWSYRPVKYNDWGQDNGTHSAVEFQFDNSSVASFYRLKWVK